MPQKDYYVFMRLNSDRSNEILNGNIIKGIIKMALPLMFLNLINTAYALVDTYFVGRINELAVGAVSLVAPIISCVLDPLFIMTLGLGTFGAAIATMLSKALMAPAALVILFSKKQPVRLSKGMFKLSGRLVATILKVAFPATIGQFLASFGFVLMSKEIVSYGSIIMSAYGIGNQISSLFYIPLNGIGSALTTFIGQNLGNNDPKRARECYRRSMILMACSAAIFTVIGFVCAPYAIHLFIRNASDLLVKEALIYAYFSIFTSFCMGWFNNLMAVYNGSGNTLIAMILSACRLFAVRIPVIYLLARFTDLQHIGIWVAMIVSNLIICLCGQMIYKVYPWDKKGIKI